MFDKYTTQEYSQILRLLAWIWTTSRLEAWSGQRYRTVEGNSSNRGRRREGRGGRGGKISITRKVGISNFSRFWMGKHRNRHLKGLKRADIKPTKINSQEGGDKFKIENKREEGSKDKNCSLYISSSASNKSLIIYRWNIVQGTL